MTFAAGQRWTYHTPEGHHSSRIVIGAIVTFGSGQCVICCAVSEAPRRHADGSIETVTIPFLPLSESAFRDSVVALDGMSELPEDFGERLKAWSEDPKGLSTFTVTFDGFLDEMITHQIEQITAAHAA